MQWIPTSNDENRLKKNVYLLSRLDNNRRTHLLFILDKKKMELCSKTSIEIVKVNLNALLLYYATLEKF